MFEVIDVFYHKNCFLAKVSKNGKYKVEGVNYELSKGDYMINSSYDYVRKLTPESKYKAAKVTKKKESNE